MSQVVSQHIADEEVKAVQIMAASMKETPQSYTLLHTQCDFLRSKGKFEWALKLARHAVNSAPSEFVTWEKLTDLYIDLEDYESVRLLVVAGIWAFILSLGITYPELMSYVHLQWARCPQNVGSCPCSSATQGHHCRYPP